MCFIKCLKAVENWKAKYTHFYRQLRGEELQGLGMNELMKLEKLVETGLSRVGKTKVFYCVIVIFFCFVYYSNKPKSFHGLQNDKLLNELSKLKARASSETYLCIMAWIIRIIFPLTLKLHFLTPKWHPNYICSFSSMQELQLMEENALLKQQAEVIFLPLWFQSSLFSLLFVLVNTTCNKYMFSYE